MDVLSVVLFVIICACFYIFYSSKWRRSNMPPEPFGLPLIGHIPFLKPRDFIAYMRYRKYGPICTLRRGLRPYILLNSYQAIHEAFIGQADTFSGRPRNEYLDKLIHKSGILRTDGPVWQEHRRMTLRLLREFGSGRDVGENIVQEECNMLKETLLKHKDLPLIIKPIFTASINNVISRFIFGERYGSEDKDFAQFARFLDQNLAVHFIDTLPFIFSLYVKVPILLKFHSLFTKFEQRFEWVQNYVRDKVEQRKKLLQMMDPPPTELSEARDICEAFIIEQAKQEATNPGKHTYTEWQVLRNIFELFLAGTETTATTLTWASLLLSINPDIQRRVHQEIEEKIGRDRQPRMTDRLQLPYVCAVMDEVLRFSSLVPKSVEHSALADTELMGYTIPANIMIVSNLYGAHHDPELWARPEEFYPDHFLTPEGNYRPSKHLIPFSIGKRACLGESLAKLEYFLALVTLMQSFEVRLADPNMDIEAVLLGTPGLIRSPLPHEVIFTPLEKL